jgi:hypothetical protein
MIVTVLIQRIITAVQYLALEKKTPSDVTRIFSVPVRPSIHHSSGHPCHDSVVIVQNLGQKYLVLFAHSYSNALTGKEPSENEAVSDNHYQLPDTKGVVEWNLLHRQKGASLGELCQGHSITCAPPKNWTQHEACVVCTVSLIKFSPCSFF